MPFDKRQDYLGKSVEQLSEGAQRVGECLISPKTRGIVRKIYQRRHGVKLPSDVLVCHTCDNPTCIEDSHHFLGSKKTNCDDAVQKGRHSCFTNVWKMLETRWPS